MWIYLSFFFISLLIFHIYPVNFQNGFSAVPNKVIQTMKVLKYKKQRDNLEGWKLHWCMLEVQEKGDT